MCGSSQGLCRRLRRERESSLHLKSPEKILANSLRHHLFSMCFVTMKSWEKFFLWEVWKRGWTIWITFFNVFFWNWQFELKTGNKIKMIAATKNQSASKINSKVILPRFLIRIFHQSTKNETQISFGLFSSLAGANSNFSSYSTTKFWVFRFWVSVGMTHIKKRWRNLGKQQKILICLKAKAIWEFMRRFFCVSKPSQPKKNNFVFFFFFFTWWTLKIMISLASTYICCKATHKCHNSREIREVGAARRGESQVMSSHERTSRIKNPISQQKFRLSSLENWWWSRWGELRWKNV